MYLTYTLEGGKKLLVFLGGDILLKHCYPMSDDGYYHVSEEISIDIEIDENGELYFKSPFDSKPKYLKDYDSISLNELIKKTNSWFNTNSITTSEILGTFMKYKEEVGLLINLPAYERIKKVSSDEEKEYKKIFLVLTEEKFTKSDWYHTIELKGEEGTFKTYFPFLASLITKKEIKLVNKNEYIKLLNKNEYNIVLYFSNFICEYKMDELSDDFALPSNIKGFSIICKFIDPITHDITSEEVNRCFINDNINYEKLSKNLEMLIKEYNGKSKGLK